MSRPIDVRRTVRLRVQAILAAEVPELRRAIVGFYWPFRGEIDLVRFMAAIVTEAGHQWHRQPTSSADSHMTMACDDAIECSSPPCLLGEFS
jgi:hypothetical protein